MSNTAITAVAFNILWSPGDAISRKVIFSPDTNNTEKYINDPEAWDTTQRLMKDILDDIGLDYVEADGEAAFYGPKLDLQFRNVFGKEDTLFTVQIDFANAERFNMTYVDSDGEKKRPYIIHRSSIGCYERTLAMLIVPRLAKALTKSGAAG